MGFRWNFNGQVHERRIDPFDGKWPGFLGFEELPDMGFEMIWVPSGELTEPFSMAIFNSYVKLPEDN